MVSTLKMNLKVEKYLDTKHRTSHFDVALQLNAQQKKRFSEVALKFLFNAFKILATILPGRPCDIVDSTLAFQFEIQGLILYNPCFVPFQLKEFCFQTPQLIDGFQVEFVNISQVINHMTCYKFKCSHWLKLQHIDWRANLVKYF